jgi:transposase
MQSESGLGIGVERLRSNGKRVYALAHKRSVVEQCLMPGASVAGVALAHGINANLVRKWIDKHKAVGRLVSASLLPVTIDGTELQATKHPRPARPRPAASDPSCLIEVEVHDARVRLYGAVDAERLRCIFDALRTRP